MYKKLTAPEYHLILQTVELNDGIYIIYKSSKSAHCDTCRVYFTDDALDAVVDADVSDCRVDMGSDDDFDNIIDGRGTWMNDGTELLIQDGMWRLLTTKITATFVGCHPQEAIRYILTLCGVTDYKLDDTVYDVKQTLTISSINGRDAILEVNSAWGIDIPFFYWNDTFYWGMRPEQEYLYELNDSNILDLEKNGDIWTAEVIGVPWLHHSQYININHESLIAVGDIESVTVESNGKSFTDMYITFREAEDG